MNQQNINTKVIKEVFYDANLLNVASTINFTVENCHVNAFVEQIIINFTSADTTCQNIVCSLLDRGNGFTGPINGLNPVTFTSIGFSTYTPQKVVPNASNTQITIFVDESVQDSEGLGQIYVQLSKATGLFNVSFTMTVIYRPEVTNNVKLNLLDQSANRAPQRVLSQVGSGTYAHPASIMIDQTNAIAHRAGYRNNIEFSNYGFNVSTANPIFYFGTPVQTKRWFLGFGSDCFPGIGIVTFSYFNGANFVAMASTTVFNGAQGPGTYKFAYDGVIIFNPDPSQVALNMANDPLGIYNRTIIGLGTLGTNNTVNNPSMYWYQCQIGFLGIATVQISAIQPLIATDYAITTRRRLIG